MFQNYLKVARRILRRNPVYSAINIGGLSVGLAAALLITLFVMDEHAFDEYHDNSDRIVRLTRENSALSAAPMGPALREGLAGVESMARLVADDGVLFEPVSGERFEERMILADSSFLHVFDHDFILGDRTHALSRRDAMVISRSMAERLFGKVDAVGNTVRTIADGEIYEWEVTGVIEDIPDRSHLQYSAIASFQLVAEESSRMQNWTTNWLHTYLLLTDPTQISPVNGRLQGFMENRAHADLAPFRLIPITDIHLTSNVSYEIDPQGSMALVVGISAVALLILLIACANFTNMAVARATTRAREVGMRKALGAHRTQLIAQFLGEAGLMVVLAGILALVMAAFSLPLLNQLAGKEMVFADLLQAPVIATFLAILAGTGLLGGGYPSWVLARFRPADTMRGRTGGSGRQGLLRKSLVVAQFAVSMFLIVSTLFVFRQIRFMQSTELGFEDKARVVIEFNDDTLEDKRQTVIDRFKAVPGVQQVTLTDVVPGDDVSDFLYRPEGWPDPDDLPGWDTYFVDAPFVSTLQIEVVRGRDFDRNSSSDRTAFLINEEAAKTLAAEVGEEWENPIGRQLDFLVPGPDGWETNMTGPVIGVVKDFHYRSLHSQIQPLVIQYRPAFWDMAVMSVAGDDIGGIIAGIKEVYESFGIAQPFEFEFLDSRIDAQYDAEVRTARLVTYFSILAIAIACLGLFAVSSYAAMNRAREIGIRKVFGASVSGIGRDFVGQYTRLVLVSAVLALPAAWYVLNQWLQAFALRIELSSVVFAYGLGITLLLAIVTVSHQAYRSATMNPATVLRQP